MLTVGALADALHGELGLRWITGEGGAGRVLQTTLAQRPRARLFGYLNLIRSHPVQLFGAVEADYVAGLAQSERRALMDALANGGAACVLVVDAVLVPSELVLAAEATALPVLATDSPVEVCLEALGAFFDQARTEHATLHGVFMEVKGLGVLLSGAPGLGKSELALELISRGHRLIADDAPDFIRASGETILGRCPEVLQDFLEVRGLGILDVRAMFGANAVKREEALQLIIHLERVVDPRSHLPDRLRGQHRTRCVLGLDVPEVVLPLLPGSNLAVLVEGAVGNHLLLMNGYNASDHFAARQQGIVNRGEI